MAGKRRVIGLVANLVPYHAARWSAFAERFGGDVFVVETTDRDGFAVLETAGGEGSFERVTLFEGREASGIGRRELVRRVRATLERLEPDVVCISGYGFRASLAALHWATLQGVPVVVCSESKRSDSRRHAVQEWLKSRAVRMCAAGLAGGTPQAGYLAELGLGRERVFTGYDAVDNRHFAAGADAARAKGNPGRMELGLPRNFFLACSRFGEKKNLLRLVQAYGRYAGKAETGKSGNGRVGRGEAWHLVLVGDGALRGAVEGEIGKLGRGAYAHLAGARGYGELPAHYGLARAFVHASTTEQWGLVVNEAMASGLPVLVSNRCGCAPDLVREGVNGHTFDPYDVEGLAELMGRVSGSPEARLKEMGEASQRIIGGWGTERFAAGLTGAVEKALETAPRRASWAERVLLRLLMLR
ncbi:MAG TPA: glycosyltransferase family 4 protein [Verrucomicrobiae bacterium]